jgi:hypothetical protein
MATAHWVAFFLRGVYPYISTAQVALLKKLRDCQKLISGADRVMQNIASNLTCE